MTRVSAIDRKLDALLAGRELAAGDELAAELSFMLEQLDEAFPAVVVVSEQVEDAHLARMVEAAAELPAPVTVPMAPARHGVLARTRDGLSRKVAAATLALTTAFGGAAYAGVLPTRVQGLVADAAAVIGLQLPRPGDDGADDRAGTAHVERADDDTIEITEGRADDDHRRPADAAGYAPGAGADDRRTATAGSDDDRAGGGGVDDDREWDDDVDDDEGRGTSDDDEAGDDEADDDEADEPADYELGDHDDESDDESDESGDDDRRPAYEEAEDEADERVGGSSGDDSDSDDGDLEEGSDD